MCIYYNMKIALQENKKENEIFDKHVNVLLILVQRVTYCISNQGK